MRAEDNLPRSKGLIFERVTIKQSNLQCRGIELVCMYRNHSCYPVHIKIDMLFLFLFLYFLSFYYIHTYIMKMWIFPRFFHLKLIMWLFLNWNKYFFFKFWLIFEKKNTFLLIFLWIYLSNLSEKQWNINSPNFMILVQIMTF